MGKDTGLGNKPLIVAISLIAAIIGIITFLCGKQSAAEFMATDVPSGVTVITVVVPQPASKPKESSNQPIVIVVTQESQSSSSQSKSLYARNDIKSPGQFIQDYYAFISSGNYQQAWSMLSQNFKNIYNASGYQPYANWWNTVKAVEVLSVNTENQDSYSANLSVELKYYYQNGKIDTYDLMSFTLIFDSDRNDWLINDAHLVKGTR